MKPDKTLQYFLLLSYTVFSGALRSLSKENQAVSNILFGLQICLPLTMILYRDNFRRNTSGSHLKVFLLFLIPMIFYAFNPLNYSVYHGLYGLILHSIFWIMMLFYLNYQQSIRLNDYTNYFLAFCLLELVVGIFQYNALVNVLIDYSNNSAATTKDVHPVAMVADSVRASGTFSYIAGFTAFNTFTLFLTCYFARVKPVAPITFLLFFTGLYSSFLSGSRAAVIVFILTISVFIITEALTRDLLQKSFQLLIIPCCLWFLNYSVNDPLYIQDGFVKSYHNFMIRLENNKNEGISRLSDDLMTPFTNQFQYPITGIGLGATYQGANIRHSLNPLLAEVPFEGELFRLLIEGGYGILILRFTLLGYVLYFLRFSIAFKLYLFMILGLCSSLVFNCYNSIFTACGLILLNHAYSDKITCHYEKA